MSSLFSEPVQAIVGINVLLTLSLLFPFLAGVWSLGLPGFMAIGAYVAAWCSMNWGMPIGLAVAAGALSGALVSIPFGLLALRIRGIYLAIATLAAAELITLFFSHFKPTGGVMGLAGIPYIEAHWIVAAAAACFTVCVCLYRSRLGKAMFAVGSDPLVATCNGLSVSVMQLLALLFSGGLAGLAGGLYAHYYSFIGPANFGFSRTIDILLFLVAGGLTPLGAAVGSAALSIAPQLISGIENWAPALYAAVVILIMAVLPDGIFPKNRIGALAKSLRQETERAAPGAPLRNSQAKVTT